jgi:hydroxymethylbilane synthase
MALPFTLATRGSRLALVQTDLVRQSLTRAHPGLAPAALVVRTKGDLDRSSDLAAMGGSGVFTKELEAALRDGRARAAVHSLKDLPVRLPDDLALGAILPRADPADVVVSRTPRDIASLPPRSSVGTGSPRRRAMLLALRPDLRVEAIRGNVPTRLSKLARGEFDAVILAAAGLARLGLAPSGGIRVDDLEMHASLLPTFLPAPGQGAIAVEARADDGEALGLLAAINDPATASAVAAERAVLAALGGGCHLALGALGRVEGDRLHLEAAFFAEPGGPEKRASLTGPLAEAASIGHKLAAMLHE